MTIGVRDVSQSNIMNKISHQGIVEAIEGDEVIIRFVQTAACASCKATSHCSASDKKEKVVRVTDIEAARSHVVGDNVTVAMPVENGRLAVLLAFVVPFIILVSVLTICFWVTKDETTAALIGILALIPYYVILHLLEKRISRQFAFVIEKKSNIN